MAKALIVVCALLGVDYVKTNPECIKGHEKLPLIRPDSRCAVPPTKCTNSKYRSYDGSCNNLKSPGLGMPNTPYKRLLSFNYADGISQLPVSVTGEELPNARKISTAAFPAKLVVDPKWNLNAQQWGQLVTHDMSLTAPGVSSGSGAAVCCSNGRLAPDATTNAVCAPIKVPADDKFHIPHRTQCLNFIRTGSTRDRNCTAAHSPALPITIVTAYMDLSLVYGNSESEVSKLRAFRGGRMFTDVRNGREWPPQQTNTTQICDGAVSATEPCYKTGDIRSNQSPHLAILQTVMLREHNRIANKLAELNPQWNDEKIFQEARRIIIAQNQHINYNEYLPILLGYDNMVMKKLLHPDAAGYVKDYNPEVDPSVSDEHATAAFRYFHTLIRGYLYLMKEDRQLAAFARLSDWFNRPILLEENNFFNELTIGLTAQPQSASDQFWDSETVNFLFRNGKNFGSDLRALDIQRGRDHGLGTYLEARAKCALSVAETFDDLKEDMSEENVNILSTLYKDVKDIDLVVGGSLEDIVPGTQTGPTYLCLLIDQFYRTRVGDRFFYENGQAKNAFTIRQLQSIRNVTIARILCDNTNIQNMQRRAFQLISNENPLVLCKDLPEVDLNLWQDKDK